MDLHLLFNMNLNGKELSLYCDQPSVKGHFCELIVQANCVDYFLISLERLEKLLGKIIVRQYHSRREYSVQ